MIIISADIISQWCNAWSSASGVNFDLVHDRTIHPPGFSLPSEQWCTLNHFRTNQGHSGACCKLWGMDDSDLCAYVVPLNVPHTLCSEKNTHFCFLV